MAILLYNDPLLLLSSMFDLQTVGWISTTRWVYNAIDYLATTIVASNRSGVSGPHL